MDNRYKLRLRQRPEGFCNLSCMPPKKKRKQKRRLVSPERAARKHLPARKVVCIACEGKRTEPEYFAKLREARGRKSGVVMHIKAFGRGIVGMYEAAVNWASGMDYDKLWLVFDKDETKDDTFDRTIKQIEQHGHGAAWSNPCFEYWLCLHLDERSAASCKTRKQSQKHWRKICQSHNAYTDKKLDDTMLAALMQHRLTAAKRAKKQMEQFSPEIPPSRRIPATNLFRLLDWLDKGPHKPGSTGRFCLLG